MKINKQGKSYLEVCLALFCSIFFYSILLASCANNAAAWTDNGAPIQFVTDCGTLSTSNAAYYLTTDISDYPSTCFTIDGDNITFNGMGYTIGGVFDASQDGIYANGRTNITVMNISINYFGLGGVYFEYCFNSTIKNVTTYTVGSGAFLAYDTGSIVANNSFLNSQITYYSAHIEYSIYTKFINNTLDAQAFTVPYNTFLTITDNTITGTSHGITLHYTSDSYIARNRIYSTTYGGIYACYYGTCNNNTIEDNYIEGSSQGIVIGGDFQYNDTIYNNTVVSSSGQGFFFQLASGNNITSNHMTDVTSAGIYMYPMETSTDNYIVNNTINGTMPEYGVYFITSGAQVTQLIDNKDFKKYYFGSDGNLINLSDTTYGSVYWVAPLKATGSDLQSDVQFANNSIYINSSNSDLNMPSNITFLNTGIIGASKVINNGVLCTLCNITTSSETTYTAAVPSGGNFSVADSEPPIITLLEPSSGFNASSSPVKFNFTVNDSSYWPLNCTIYIDAIARSTNSSVHVFTNTTFVVNVTEGVHKWNVSCYDVGLNWNTSLNRTFNADLYSPTYSGLYYTPNSTDDVDPGEQISVNVVLNDSFSQISNATLFFNDGSVWDITPLIFKGSGRYQANITLIGSETNYTFYVWANDSFGHINTSSSTTFASYWDCSWKANKTYSYDNFGWITSKYIGNITIYNTGDDEYSPDCFLTFEITHNLQRDKVQFFNSGTYQKKPVFPPLLVPGASVSIPVNFTYASEKVDENLIITVIDRSELSSLSSTTINSTHISTNGPYLYQTIDSVTTDADMFVQNGIYFVYLTPQIIELNASLRNGIGDGSSNSSAYNVSFNWTFDDDLTIIQGDIGTADNGLSSINSTRSNLYYLNITDGIDSSERHIHTILIDTNSDVASLNESNYTFTAASMGYNVTGEPIVDSNNNSVNNQSITLNFVCYSISDGVCVEDCILTDPDCWVCGNSRLDPNEDCDDTLFDSGLFCTGSLSCSACSAVCTPSSNSIQNSGGGGGGGGSGISIHPSLESPSIIRQSDINNLFQTMAEYEIIRGEENSFLLVVNNTFDATIRDLEVHLNGYMDKYLTIYPTEKIKLGRNESQEYNITIKAPEYFSEVNYKLNFSINGVASKSWTFQNSTLFQVEYLNETRIVILHIIPFSREIAKNYVENVHFMIAEMKKSGYSIDKITKENIDAQSLYDDIKFSELESYHHEVSAVYNNAKEAASLKRRMNSDIISKINLGLRKEMTKSVRLVELAQAAFSRGDYEMAIQRLNEAKITLALETNGKFNILVYFQQNWPVITVLLMCLIIFTYLCYHVVLYNILKQRIVTLKNEKEIIYELVRDAQRDCFDTGKLPMEEYLETIKEYDSRLNNIVNLLLTYETAIQYIFKIFVNRVSRLREEKKRIISLIKETQELYINHNQLETRLYHNRIRSYGERLAEIEEELVDLALEQRLGKKIINALHPHYALSNPVSE